MGRRIPRKRHLTIINSPDSPGRVIDAKWQTIPQGIKPDAEMKEILMEAAALLCENSPLPNLMIDLCMDCSEAGARPKLVEINPDILELKAA